MHTIAFFCDAHILPGFHAALASLLINHHSHSSLNIILFADRLTKKQKELTVKTFIKNKKKNQTFEVREAPKNMRIPGANALVGNFTTYGRLFLSDLLPDKDLVLYLDSDIIINCDIIDVFNKMVGNYTLFVSGVGERNWSLDKKLYQNAKLKMNGLCFNAGILGVNLKKWREVNGFKKCLDCISLYPNQFLSADQALLNVTFQNDFFVLPNNINIGAFYSRKVEIISGIYHFIGLPKPWNPFMYKYHKNYFLWYLYINKSALKFKILDHFNFIIFLRQLNHYRKILFHKDTG